MRFGKTTQGKGLTGCKFAMHHLHAQGAVQPVMGRQDGIGRAGAQNHGGIIAPAPARSIPVARSLFPPQAPNRQPCKVFPSVFSQRRSGA